MGKVVRSIQHPRFMHVQAGGSEVSKGTSIRKRSAFVRTLYWYSIGPGALVILGCHKYLAFANCHIETLLSSWVDCSDVV